MWVAHSSRNDNTPWKSLSMRLQQGGQQPNLALLHNAVGELLEQQKAFLNSPPQEVAEALSYLCQQLLGEASSADARVLQARVQLCQLIHTVASTTQHAALPSTAAHIVMSALRCWADSPAMPSSSQATLLQHAALHAIAALIPKNLTQLRAPEVAALLAVLNSTAVAAVNTTQSARNCTAQGSTAPAHVSVTESGMTTDHFVEDSAESVHLALSALHQCFPKSGAAIISQEAVVLVLTSCVSALHTWCTGRARPVEAPGFVKLYISLTRLLATLIMEERKGWVQHAALIVEGLRRLLTYGTTATPAGGNSQGHSSIQKSATTSPAGGGAVSGGRSAYRPPHMREGGSSSGNSRARRSSDVSVGDRWSDSELSDTEGGAAGATDRVGYHKVRLGALLCIQSMAKADSRAMHPHWTSLLPVQQPLQPRPLMPHVVTLLLHDPIPKVRGLAAATIASLLEGTASKGYLMVAEAHNTISSTTGASRTAHIARGFTTLSVSLGQLLLCTHAGLLASLQKEQSSLVLSPLLHALCVLVRAAPGDRLPGSFLPETLQCLRACGTNLLGPGHLGAELPVAEQHAILAAYMACLAEVLTTKKAMPALVSYLKQPSGKLESVPGIAPSTGGGAVTPEPAAVPPVQGAALAVQGTGAGSSGASGGTGQQLAAELFKACSHPQAIVRIEALAALRGLVEHCDTIITPSTWEQVQQVVSYSLAAPPSSRAPSRSPSSSSLAAHGATRPASGSVAGSSTAAAPEDKARQHAIKLLAAYLTAVAVQQRCAPTSAQQFSEGDAATGAPGLPYISGSSLQATAFMASVGSPRTNGCRLPMQALSRAADPTGPGTSSASSGTAVPAAGGGPVATAAAAAAVSDAAGASDRWEDVEVAFLMQYWQQALQSLLQAALLQPTPMVKAAALTALCDMPEVVLAALPAEVQQQVVAAGAQAVAKDATQPAVCAAGCKLLGALATFPYVLQHPTLCDVVIRALPGVLQHPAVSVRMAAAWAVASAAEALAQLGHDTQSTGELHANSIFSVDQLQRLCNAALVAAQGDGEKVRSQGMRAVAALLFALPAQLLQAGLQGIHSSSDNSPAMVASNSSDEPPLRQWLTSALSSVQSGLTTGNAKVQWAACVAAQALFSNHQLMAQPDSPQLCSPLLLILLMLVRECTNFKVRTQAAAALGSLSGRLPYGATFPDAITVVCAALDSLESDPSATTSGGNSMNASAEPMTGPAALSQDVDQAATPQDSSTRSFPNFKHLPGLIQQLRFTLVHLLGLTGAGDGGRCREVLSKRWEVVGAGLEAVAQAGVQAYLSATERAGDEQETSSKVVAGSSWEAAVQKVLAVHKDTKLASCWGLSGGMGGLVGQGSEADDVAALLPSDLDQIESGSTQAYQPTLPWTRLALCVQDAHKLHPVVHVHPEQQGWLPAVRAVCTAVAALQAHALPAVIGAMPQHSASVSRIAEALADLRIEQQTQIV